MSRSRNYRAEAHRMEQLDKKVRRSQDFVSDFCVSPHKEQSYGGDVMSTSSAGNNKPPQELPIPSRSVIKKAAKLKSPKVSAEVKLLVQALKNNAFEAGELLAKPRLAPPSQPPPSQPPVRNHQLGASDAPSRDNLFTWHRENESKGTQNTYKNMQSRDFNARILEFIHRNHDVKELFSTVLDKSDQLQTATDVLEKINSPLHSAVITLFEEEHCENVERFMELFEKFAQDMGVNQRTLLSHFENKNYLFKVGISCLKDVGIREPLRGFAKFLKEKSIEDGPAFYIFKIIGKQLEQGESPNLERPQPYTWEEFYELYSQYMDAAGVPDNVLVKSCARRVFEEGVLTLQERGVKDPVKKFVDYVRAKQQSLNGIWRETSEVVKQSMSDSGTEGQQSNQPNPAWQRRVHRDTSPLARDRLRSRTMTSSPETRTRTSFSNRLQREQWRNRCASATMTLANKASPRQLGHAYASTSPQRAPSPTLTIQTKSSFADVMASDSVVGREILDNLDPEELDGLIAELGLLQHDSDDCDYFGKMISSYIKKIPDDKTRELAKLQVHKTLFSLRYGEDS